MPTLIGKRNEWYILNLRYIDAYEKQEYINYFNNHIEDIIWLEIPQENIIKWKYKR